MTSHRIRESQPPRGSQRRCRGRDLRKLIALCQGSALVLGSFGCDRKGATELEEAKLLVAGIDSLAGDVASRGKELQALERRRFQTATVERARKSCVGAHKALMTAELEQQAAEQAIGQAHYRKAGDSIAHSDRALETAQALLPKCLDAVDGFRARIALRRKSQGSS